MEVKQIKDNKFAQEWNDFVIQNSSPASFLQSWEWGDFREKVLAEKVFRFGVFENGNLLCVAQLVKRDLPSGRFYLNCAKGPVITKTQKHKNTKTQIFELLINEIKKIAKEEKIVFFRIAPPYENVAPSFSSEQIDNSGLKAGATYKLGFAKPKILTNLIEPENTLVLNLERPEEELLRQMHSKTRYNIRLAEKHGIIVKIQDTRNLPRLTRVKAGKIQKNSNIQILISKKNIDDFYDLLKETAKRDKINIYDKSYYENLIDYFSQMSNVKCQMFLAEFEDKILSAILVIGFGNTATYFYGASSNKMRELMPNYAVQWQAIKWAKEQGYNFYDFWGVSDKKKGWAGITRFKKGFVSKKTGDEINFLGTFDYVLNKKWYNFYRIGKLIKFSNPL